MPLLFALTMFVSATLLFLVQPMVGKMILPLLGGTPAVWNTCMVFYQALLLAGYYYSHVTTSIYDSRRQTIIHTVILIIPVVAMVIGVLFSSNHSPIPIAKSLSPQGDEIPFFGVIAVLCVAIALPFFVVSTSAPLLQKWFAYTGHPAAKDPYFLYGASNFGSLLALIAYPMVVEPNLRIIDQTWVWAIGCVLLVGMCLYCGHVVRNAKPKPIPTDRGLKIPIQIEDTEPPPTFLTKLRWLGLAFVPSSLMLGVTTFMSTDIASLPLLWIIPLALYLITFIIAFSRMPKEFHLVMTLITPVMILLLVFLNTSSTKPKFGMILLLHMATFFCVTMTCHGELARTRPSAKYLTSFYLIMSIGGMLGGLFNSLVAPLVFTFTSEYPLTLVAACLLLPKLNLGNEDDRWFSIWDLIWPLLVFILARGLFITGREFSLHLYFAGREALVGLAIFGLVAGIGCALVNDRRFRISLLLLLGTSLLLYGVVGGLLDWGQEQSKELSEGLANIITWPRVDYVRWIFAAIPLGAFGAYWFQYGEHPTKWQYMGIGLGAIVLSYCVIMSSLNETAMDFSSRYIKPEIISWGTFRQILVFGIPAMVCYFFVERPIRFGLCVAAVLLATYVAQMKGSQHVIGYDRSFFGTLKIENEEYSPEDRNDNYIYEDRDEYPEPFFSGSSFYKEVKVERGGKEISFFRQVHPLRRLAHGTTLHGIQRRDGMARSISANLSAFNAPMGFNAAATVAIGSAEHWQFPGREPLTYYHRTGPVGKMFEAFRSQNRSTTEVACIGLGTGSLSSYGLPGQKMTFFEIDTHVVRHVFDKRPLAERQAKPNEGGNSFDYLNSAIDQGVEIDFAMGDARISLERMEGRKFGMMLIDAFSSDSIPVHLLTKESVQLFFDRLEDDGLLAMHISNRYLELEPVVERIARELKVEAKVMSDFNEGYVGKTASTWIVLARNKEALGPILKQTKEMNTAIDALASTSIGHLFPAPWTKLKADDKVGLWTDDYSPILSILRESFSLWGSDN